MGEIMTTYLTGSAFVDGAWRVGDGPQFNSIDPASGEAVWSGTSASSADVEQAFAAAKTAFRAWSRTPLSERIAIAERFKVIATERKTALAELIARETGKVLWDATGEAGVVAAKVDVSIKSYHERTGAAGFDTAFGRAALIHKPHGVMAVFGPYNFPAHLPNGQIIPSLLAGNTVVFKPSEQTPLVGAFLMQMYADAGFPAGTVNLVHGAREVGGALLNASEVSGVLFTGSPQTGAFIHKHFGGRPDIVLALEMGGNNPLIAWDIDRVDAAATLIAQSAFITTGQRCTCARRLIVPEGAAGDIIVDAVAGLMDGFTIGAWNDDKAAFMGPLVSADIAAHVVKKAAQLGGKTLREAKIDDRGAAFIRPGMVDVTGVKTADEEIFGPVLQVIRTGSFEQAIEIGNATKFGLAAGLISDNAAHWDVFARDSHAGVVNFNRPTTGASGALPFGGPGLSGNHNPGAFYAADFCAWPMASQISETVKPMTSPGMLAEPAS